MRISDWSSDVCSSDLGAIGQWRHQRRRAIRVEPASRRTAECVYRRIRGSRWPATEPGRNEAAQSADRGSLRNRLRDGRCHCDRTRHCGYRCDRQLSRSALLPARECTHPAAHDRSEEHTSELQSLMRISYAVFCLKKKQTIKSIPIISASNKDKSNAG